MYKPLSMAPARLRIKQNKIISFPWNNRSILQVNDWNNSNMAMSFLSRPVLYVEDIVARFFRNDVRRVSRRHWMVLWMAIE